MNKLSIMAWSFAKISMAHEPLLDAISASASRIISGSEDWTPESLLALVHTFASLGSLPPQLAPAAFAALSRRGTSLDAAAETLPPQALAPPPLAKALWPNREPRLMPGGGKHLVALWKPPGWTVTVGFEDAGDDDEGWAHAPPGAEEELPGGALGSSEPDTGPSSVHAAGRLQHWVARQLGRDSPLAADAGMQHGLLHRLDRDTSGPLAMARSYRGYLLAMLQFSLQRVRKEYVCLCAGHAASTPRLLTAALEAVRSPDGLKRSVVSSRGAEACTEVCEAGGLMSPEGEALSVVRVRLRSGRMHQIRAHLHHEGNPLVGDALYGRGPRPWCSRMFLHSYRLALDIGTDDGYLDVCCPPPSDLQSALSAAQPVDGPARVLLLDCH